MKLCICQICICGHHLCDCKVRRVPFAKGPDEGDLHSECRDEYKNHGLVERREPIRPCGDANWKGDQPSVKESMTKHDYMPHLVQVHHARPPETYKPPSGKMASDTTYKNEYKPKKTQRASKIIGAECAKDGTMPGTLPVKMENYTTYKQNYTPKPLYKREQAKGKETTLTVTGQPFSGESETRLCFQAPSYQKRDAIVPKRSDIRFGDKFHGDTTHKLDFSPKTVEPCVPVKPRSKWKPSLGKFFGETTHAQDYKCPIVTIKAELTIPKQELKWVGGSFEGTSHYKEDYPVHHISPRKLPQWHPSFRSPKRSEGPMAKMTTHKLDFKVHPLPPQVQRSKSLKHNLTLPSGQMEKETTTRRDFRAIDQPIVAKSFKPVTKYTGSKGKFEDCTTTRHDFTPKPIDRPKILKAENNLQLEKGRMENKTTVRCDYKGLHLECPAKYLKLYGKKALPEDYQFQKQEGGHEYYKVQNPGQPVVVA